MRWRMSRTWQKFQVSTWGEQWSINITKTTCDVTTSGAVVAVNCWKTASEDIESNMKLTDMVCDPNSIGSKSLFYKKMFLHRIQVEFWWAYDVLWYFQHWIALNCDITSETLCHAYFLFCKLKISLWCSMSVFEMTWK